MGIQPSREGRVRELPRRFGAALQAGRRPARRVHPVSYADRQELGVLASSLAGGLHEMPRGSCQTLQPVVGIAHAVHAVPHPSRRLVEVRASGLERELRELSHAAIGALGGSVLAVPPQDRRLVRVLAPEQRSAAWNRRAPLRSVPSQRIYDPHVHVSLGSVGPPAE